MRSIGIDIGTFSVKVCVVESTKKGLFLQDFHEHIYNSVNPLDKNLEVIEFLRKLFDQNPTLQNRFICGMPQDAVSVHSKLFPFKDRIKIFRSLPFELEEDTPFNPDETLYDGRITRTSSQKAEVLACACPKESVKKYLQLMSDSSISPQLMTPEGFALSNHFIRWMEAPPEVNKIFNATEEDEQNPSQRKGEALLHIGHSKTILMVMDDSGPIDIRTFSWGGDNIAKAIEARYSISYGEAIKQLRSNGFILTTTDGATTDQVTFSNTIASAVQELVKDLRLALMEVQASTQTTITQLSMTGGVSRMQNLGPFLTQGIEIPVNKFNLFKNYQNIYFEQNPHNNSVGISALGLAIEGLRKPRNPSISLLRSEFAVQSHVIKHFVETWGTTLKFAGIAFVALYAYASLRESFAVSMAEKADEVMIEQAKGVAHLKGSKASEAGLEKFIRQRRKSIKEIKDLESYVQMNSALEVLKKISDAAPGRSTVRMEVRSFSLRDRTVRMEGYVSNVTETEMLKKTLLSLAKAQRIDSVPTQISPPPGKVAFALQFDVDRNVLPQKEQASDRSVSQ